MIRMFTVTADGKALSVVMAADARRATVIAARLIEASGVRLTETADLKSREPTPDEGRAFAAHALRWGPHEQLAGILLE
jgi:hypothetical protein